MWKNGWIVRHLKWILATSLQLVGKHAYISLRPCKTHLPKQNPLSKMCTKCARDYANTTSFTERRNQVSPAYSDQA
jgi:hypothetical protein